MIKEYNKKIFSFKTAIVVLILTSVLTLYALYTQIVKYSVGYPKPANIKRPNEEEIVPGEIPQMKFMESREEAMKFVDENFRSWSGKNFPKLDDEAESGQHLSTLNSTLE